MAANADGVRAAAVSAGAQGLTTARALASAGAARAWRMRLLVYARAWCMRLQGLGRLIGTASAGDQDHYASEQGWEDVKVLDGSVSDTGSGSGEDQPSPGFDSGSNLNVPVSISGSCSVKNGPSAGDQTPYSCRRDIFCRIQR